MERQTRFYVSRKNGMTWLMALCMLLSAGVRIGTAWMRGTGGTDIFWGQVALPAAACLLFALICLYCGEESYYKTAIPVGMMALYFCFYTGSAQPQLDSWYMFLYCFLYFTLAIFYAVTVAGKVRHFWLLLVAYMLPLVVRGADNWQQIKPDYVLASVKLLAPDVLFLMGLLFGLFATGIQNDGKYHPTWGDRKDGRRLRTLIPMSQISPYIMVNRNGSSVHFETPIEITAMERYIRQKRREGLTTFGIMHVLMAAYARCVAKYPGMNRFLAGQKVYSRGDDLQVCMVVKKEMTTDASESVIKLHLSPRDTAEEVYRKLDREVEQVRNAPLNSEFDNTARAFTMIPGVFLKFTFWLLKLLDYFGMLPAKLLEISPFHGSLFVTSMGSLGIPPVYHHLYDFGNLPVFLAFGCKRRANEVNLAGELVQRKYIDMKFVVDERIVDGFYYAAVLKYLKRLLQHPELLDEDPEEVVEDIA